MLVCKHCSTPNSLDSTFCKKCGTAVPADLRREAAVQLDKLIDEGLVALNAGRTAEALAIADSAVASDPTHLGALHLKSAVHERRGEIADALESAERIVELNPDSELDRIKRNGLRSSLLDASTPVRPDRRLAFAAAAATMVLVACGGILIARRGSEPSSSTVASNTSLVPQIGTKVEDPIVVDPHPAAPAPVTPPQTTNQPDPATNNGAEATRTNLPNVPVDPSVIHLPTAQPEGDGVSISPINPGAPPETTPDTRPKQNTPPPDTKVANGDGDPNPQALKPEEPKNDGSILIEVSGGSKGRTGGSNLVPETRTNGTAVYAQVGTERFQLGDYAGAAANLEKAVAGGGDAVQLNLRLAQAYSRLGRNSEAAAAYERSRSAATSALATGKGDKERLQAARDAAEAGLKTVKGG